MYTIFDAYRGTVTGELHATTGTKVLGRARNHALVVPFYDTNIGHWIKEFGSMNILQVGRAR